MAESSGPDQRLRSGTGPFTSLSKVWQPRTAIIVATANANDMSISKSFGFEGKAARTASDLGRSSRPGSPDAYKTEAGCPCRPLAIELDGLEVERGRLTVDALANIVAEPLTDHRSDFLVPQDRADFEADRVARDFGIDLAVAERGVERLDGAKIFHGEFPFWSGATIGASRLGDVKEGRRSGLAPKTVDCDW